MTSKPLISVIVAVYNGAKTLQRCIDSVSDQTYPNKELIIIDGGSTDGTIEIIRSNQDQITYWQSEPDNGIYHAWNKALDHASGDGIWTGCKNNRRW
jgi:glycosyltransferase involved in cell wall biosynthesis